MSNDPARHFPLSVPGAKAIPGLATDVPPPSPLTSEPLQAWQRMNLAKRRLAVLGALQAGQEAARFTAIILSAECRLVGIPFDLALQLALNITFTTDTTGRRQVIRQLPRAARFGYFPPNGQPIFTGCCRDPRPHSGAAMSTKLRSYIAPYCDGACASSCSILRAIRYPERCIAETACAHVDDSDLWVHGGGYGQAGRWVYQQLALLAESSPDRNIQASSRYLSLKSNGTYSASHIRALLARMRKDGLATLVNKREGRRHVPIPTPEQVRELEQRKGVVGSRAATVRDAQRELQSYQDFVYQQALTLGDAGALATWMI